MPSTEATSAHAPSLRSSRMNANRPSSAPVIPTPIGAPAASTFHGGSESQNANRPSAMPPIAASRVSPILARCEIGGFERAHAFISGWTRAGPPNPARLRRPHADTIRSSAPTKRMISAWIIVARLPGELRREDVRVELAGRGADLQRTEEQRGEEDPDGLVAAEQRDRDADEPDRPDVEVVRRHRGTSIRARRPTLRCRRTRRRSRARGSSSDRPRSRRSAPPPG